MESEVYAYFLLIGVDFQPDEITAQVGITPTKTWTKGDLRLPGAVVRHQENGWMVLSKLDRSADLEEHIKSVLEQLQPSWDILQKLCLLHSAEFACVVYSYGGDRPAIHFDREVIKQVNELNSTIDVDSTYSQKKIPHEVGQHSLGYVKSCCSPRGFRYPSS
jgi:hypothetical protein